MVNISNVPNQRVTVSTGNNGNVDANTNANAQLARSWAVGEGLIQGEDYSAKYYANTAKEIVEDENLINVANHLTEITAVASDLENIDIVADTISTYNNLLIYEEIE